MYMIQEFPEVTTIKTVGIVHELNCEQKKKKKKKELYRNHILESTIWIRLSPGFDSSPASQLNDRSRLNDRFYPFDFRGMHAKRDADLYSPLVWHLDTSSSPVEIKTTKTYNRRDSLVVTHPPTNLPACGLHAVSSQVAASKEYKLVRNLNARVTSASIL